MKDIPARVLGYFRQRDRGLVLLLIAAVCALYLPFLGSPLFFDDANFFSTGLAAQYAHGEVPFGLRWFSNASLGWTYATFSDTLTHTYHLGNLLLHAANVIVLFYLLRQLATAVVPEANARAVLWGAWLGALIFAVHPVAVYAAGYVVQRSILMATFFALLMQLAYLRGLLTGKAHWLALAVLAYFMACFSKEHSVMMPAVLAAETFVLRFQNRARYPALALTYVCFTAIAMAVTWYSRGNVGTVYEMNEMFEQHGLAEDPHAHLLSVLTQAGLFFKYLLMWILPNPAWMSVDMRVHFVDSLTAWQGWLGILGFIAYGAAGLWLLLRSRWAALAGIALLYPWLQFAPEFAGIRLQEVFVLYRSYLWVPGLALFFPMLLAKWPGRKTVAALAAVVLLLAPVAWNRLWVFANDYRLWDDAARLLSKDQYGSANRIFYNRARAAAYTQNWNLALPDYERVVAAQPNIAVLHVGLGVVYFNLQRPLEALDQFDAATKLAPNDADGYFKKALTLQSLHKFAEASVSMEKACELKHAFACVLVKANPERRGQ